MKQDEVIEMARQVGLCRTQSNFDDWIDAGPSTLELVEFAKLVAAKEREACAKVCEDLQAPPHVSDSDVSMWDVTSLECADAIRARGEA